MAVEVRPVADQAAVLALKKAMENQRQGAQVVTETLARKQQTSPPPAKPEHLGRRFDRRI